MVNFTLKNLKIYLRFNLYFVIILFGAFSPLTTKAQFVRKGDAIKISEKCYKITEDKINRSGSIWWQNKIDLRQPFELNFILYLGSKDVNGADGIAFLFHNDPRGFNATGAVAGGLGYGVAAEFPNSQPITPSVAIEFDTYDNNNDDFNLGFDYGDIPADHSAVVYNGQISRPAFPPVWINPANPDVENNECQNYRISWNPATRELKLYFNNILRFSHTGDIINEVFNGEPMVYYGFTGSTGGLTNEQTICLLEPESAPEANDDVATTRADRQVNIQVTLNDLHSRGEPINLSRVGAPQNGTVTIAGQNVIYTPNPGFAGTDTFTYEICEASSTKCYSRCATATVSVNVTCDPNQMPQPPLITTSGSTFLCGNESVVLAVAAQNGVTYQWKKDGQNIGTNSNSLTVTEGGLYSIVLINFCGQTSGSNTVAVTKSNVPSPISISAGGPTTICSGGSLALSVPEQAGVTYQWQKNGQPVGTNNPAFTATEAGTYTIILNNSCGVTNSSNSVDVEIMPHPTPVIIQTEGPTTFCSGGQVLLFVPEQPGFTYQWQRDGQNIGNNSHRFMATQAGNYSIITSNNCNQVNGSNTVFVTVNTVPQATSIVASGPTRVCGNGSLTMQVPEQEAVLYQWKRDGLHVGENLSIFTATQPGVYTVELTNSCGSISSSNSVNFTVTPLPQPVAISAAGPTTTCVGGSLALSVPEQAEVTYQWQKNGQPIGTNSPTFTATEAGTYSIVITNSCGSASSSNTVAYQITPNLSAATISAAGQTNICNNGQVILSVPEVANVTYQWQKDGQNIGLNSPTFTATEAGVYTIATSNACNSVAGSNYITITKSPTPQAVTISASGPTTFCQTGTETITLTVPEQAGMRYQWTRNGQNTGNNSAALTISESGEYAVVLTNTCGESTTTTQPVLVQVQNRPEQPIIRANAPLEICSGGTVTLTAFPGGNEPAEGNNNYRYLWSNGATTQAITVTQQGSYSVTLITTAGCEVSSNPAKITFLPVLQEPVIVAEGATTVCGNGSIKLSVTDQPGVTYQWQKNGQPVGTNSPAFTATEAGIYSIELSNSCGRFTGSNTVTFKINPAPEPVTIQADGPVAFCQSGSVTLAVPELTGVTYQWQKDGQNTGSNTYTLKATEAGEYLVQLTNDCGTVLSINKIRVEVLNTLAAPVVTNGERCGPGKVTLTATGGKDGEYRWYTSATATTPLAGVTGGTFTTPTLQNNTTYYVSLAQSSCESERVPVTVQVLDMPQVSVSANVTINTGESTVLEATGGTTYSWQPVNGLSNPNIANPVAKPTATTTYTVTVANAAGCTEQTQVTVTLKQDLIIPTGISPNGDGVNETWEITNIQNFPQARIEIFNRWGNKIYDTTGYRNNWDGTWQGNPLPVGTYFYVITLTKDRKLTGPISIVH